MAGERIWVNASDRTTWVELQAGEEGLRPGMRRLFSPGWSFCVLAPWATKIDHILYCSTADPSSAPSVSRSWAAISDCAAWLIHHPHRYLVQTPRCADAPPATICSEANENCSALIASSRIVCAVRSIWSLPAATCFVPCSVVITARFDEPLPSPVHQVRMFAPGRVPFDNAIRATRSATRYETLISGLAGERW